MLAPKWRYSLVKPGSWRGLLRGRLPQPGRSAVKVSELVKWNRQRWPGAVAYMVIPAGRKTYWRQVAEMASSLTHQEMVLMDWPSSSRRWTSWAAKLRAGDLVIIDDTLASGQKLWRRLVESATSGVQLAGAGVLLPELKLFKPNQHRLVVSPARRHDELIGAGISEVELVSAESSAQRLEILRRELLSREPESILLVQPAPETFDLMGRFQLDDELTQLTRLLDAHGYGVRVIGAPEKHTKSGSWPVIEWTAGQRARLPAGWQQRHAVLRDAKQLLREQLR